MRKLAATANSLRSQADPERYLPQPATALDQQARALLGTGRVERALKASAERIGHHRILRACRRSRGGRAHGRAGGGRERDAPTNTQEASSAAID